MSKKIDGNGKPKKTLVVAGRMGKYGGLRTHSGLTFFLAPAGESDDHLKDLMISVGKVLRGRTIRRVIVTARASKRVVTRIRDMAVKRNIAVVAAHVASYNDLRRLVGPDYVALGEKGRITQGRLREERKAEAKLLETSAPPITNGTSAGPRLVRKPVPTPVTV